MLRKISSLAALCLAALLLPAIPLGCGDDSPGSGGSSGTGSAGNNGGLCQPTADVGVCKQTNPDSDGCREVFGAGYTRRLECAQGAAPPTTTCCKQKDVDDWCCPPP